MRYCNNSGGKAYRFGTFLGSYLKKTERYIATWRQAEGQEGTKVAESSFSSDGHLFSKTALVPKGTVSGPLRVEVLKMFDALICHCDFDSTNSVW